MTRKVAYFSAQGGLDLVTPSINRPPGTLLGCLNYQARPQGYQSIAGFERFDGRGLPSVASYWTLPFDTGTAAITAGQTVTGATSSATGETLVDAFVETGAYADGNAAGYLVLTAVSGTFADGENLQVSAATKSVAASAATERGADNDTDDQSWLQDAIETQRAKIGSITGSGPIRGIHQMGDIVYAWRDNVGATAGTMWKSTASGWSQIDLGRSIAFTSGGTYVVAEGNTITGATSAATATVKRVIVTSGTWAGGDAAGRLVLSGQTGTFQSENLNVGGNLNVATIAGNSSAIALQPGGRYEVQTFNFLATSTGTRIYGCDGKNPAFEFDGTTYVPIVTGMATDTPNHMTCHKNYLFLAFPGGSVQFSALGDPLDWTTLAGAGEFGIGENVTALISYAGALVILGRSRTAALYGSVFSGTEADAELKLISDEQGAIEWTAQRMMAPVFCDDTGIRSLETTADYGDFAKGTLSQPIKPLLLRKRAAGATITASLRSRALNQYRLFFDDEFGVVADFSGDAPAYTAVNYGMAVRCATSVDSADGMEAAYFGSDDGFVYRLDSGTSFDGEAVSGFIRFTFNHLDSPGQDKRYIKAIVEIDADPVASISFMAEYSYANPDTSPSAEASFSIYAGGGFLDEGAFNELYFDSQVVGQAEAHLDGIGTNISLCLAYESIYESQHTVSGVHLHYSLRRLIR